MSLQKSPGKAIRAGWFQKSKRCFETNSAAAPPTEERKKHEPRSLPQKRSKKFSCQSAKIGNADRSSHGHSVPVAEKGEGSALGRSASSASQSGKSVPSSPIPRDRRSETRPNPSFSSQRRYSSDGRAGNLAQGRLAPRRGMGQDRSEPRQQPVPIPGDPMARNPEEPTRHRKGRKARAGQTGPSQYYRGPRPMGGFSVFWWYRGMVAERGYP